MFAQSFGSDATADHANEMLTQDPYGALAFSRVADDLLEHVRDGREVEIDIESSQENMEFGALFCFVFQRLLMLQDKNPGLYKRPLR